MILSLLLGVAFAGELPSIDAPARTGASTPADAAVVIGLEDYAFISNVPYAQRDADAFADFLIYTRGVPLQRVHRPRGGSREQILEAVALAAEQVADDGVLWLYFAGHGAASVSTGERMMLGDDVRSDPAVFESRAVKISEVEDAARGRLMMVLDTCYSGRGRSGADLVAGTRFAVPSYVSRVEGDRAEWAAAGPDELSGPLHATRHGAFTYYAIGAMRGWADGELDGQRDGTVSSEEAQAYVSRLIRDTGETRQTPAFSSTSSWTLSSGVSELGPGEATVATASVAPAPQPGTAPTTQLLARETGQSSRNLKEVLALLESGKRPGPLERPSLEPPLTTTTFLSNGLQVSAIRSTDQPLFHLEIALRLGERHDPAGQEGLTRAMLEVATHDPELLAALGLLGASVRVKVNYENSRIWVTGLSRHLEAILATVAPMLTQPTFGSGALVRWQDAVVARLEKLQTNQGHIASMTAIELLHTDRQAPTTSSVRALNIHALEQHKRRWLGPDSAAVYLGSALPSDQVAAVLEGHLGTWPSAQQTASPPAASLSARPGVYVVDLPGSETAIHAVVPLPERTDMDYVEFDVANRAFGGGFLSRLNANLREEKGWAYNARSGIISVGGQQVWRLFTSVRNSVVVDVVAEIRAEIRKTHRESVLSKTEVENARTELRNGFNQKYDSVGAMPRELGNSWRLGLPGAWQAEYLHGLDAVTAFSANAAFRKYADPDPLTLVIVGDWNTLKKPLNALGLSVQRVEPGR